MAIATSRGRRRLSKRQKRRSLKRKNVKSRKVMRGGCNIKNWRTDADCYEREPTYGGIVLKSQYKSQLNGNDERNLDKYQIAALKSKMPGITSTNNAADPLDNFKF